MKTYVLFLRGINISGRNPLSMPLFKKELEKYYSNIITYLNSGNIIFQTQQNNVQEISNTITNILKDTFTLDIPIFLIEEDKLKEILAHAPSWWNSENKNKYDNLIFVLSPMYAEKIYENIGSPDDTMEQVEIYDNYIFWTFEYSNYQKCKWWKKTADNKIAPYLTIRKATTIIKLLEKGEQKNE